MNGRDITPVQLLASNLSGNDIYTPRMNVMGPYDDGIEKQSWHREYSRIRSSEDNNNPMQGTSIRVREFRLRVGLRGGMEVDWKTEVCVRDIETALEFSGAWRKGLHALAGHLQTERSTVFATVALWRFHLGYSCRFTGNRPLGI